jgi:heterotetrameric sarcosine oxidase gamma subunit
MPEPIYVPRSGLEHLAVPGRFGAPTEPAGATVALVQERALAAVMARKDRNADLVAAVRRGFGVDLPIVPSIAAAGAISFVWAGPGRWLAIAQAMRPDVFEKQLREHLGEVASVADQSDARILVRLSGARARDVLAKGVLIDMHPRAFRPGDVALTSIGHIRAHFWQTDAAPTYEIAIMRSFAADFWHWLMESGAAYGVLVEQA